MKFPFSNRPHEARLAVASLVLATVSLTVTPPHAVSQEAETEKFSPAVVEKADKILDDAKLRRVGKVIQSTDTAEIGRAISGLSKTRRELKRTYDDWKAVDQRIHAMELEQKRLNVQYGELNLQLARGNVAARARDQVVGMINAGLARSKILESEKSAQKVLLSSKRATLNAAEAEYAETVLAIRSDYKKLKEELDKQLITSPVQIALRVMHANFDTPEGQTADDILSVVDKRLQKIEQEVFSETIALQVVNQSLYVNVVVGRVSTRMVVDSGASLISLPSKTATELGIVIPPDAPQMRMIMADGREIPARGVTLARVRVGEFEAENVNAAILDEAATDAEPLLGMSYLGNFKFEIDMAEKSLKMLRIKTED
ncbi:MAG: retropepsin-like aspartic protease [Rubripirellula sp.]